MEKEVLIHVKGLHMMDTPEGDEPIEIVVPGEYYFRNGSHYLRYEEMLDEQGDPTINYIKISSRGMEVRKKWTGKYTYGFLSRGSVIWHFIPPRSELLKWEFQRRIWNWKKVTVKLP